MRHLEGEVVVLRVEVAVLKSQMRFIGGIAVTVAGLVSLITLLLK